MALRLAARLSASRAACLSPRVSFRARTAADCARRGGPRAAFRARRERLRAGPPLRAVDAPSWDVRVLFDGDCPLCVREVNFLRAKDDGRGKLDLVDIASETYDPAANRGVDFETAMSTIHITNDGEVITGVEVFARAYKAVGLGGCTPSRRSRRWRAASALYDFWAERRLAVTGRPTMTEVMRRGRAGPRMGNGVPPTPGDRGVSEAHDTSTVVFLL